MFKSFKRDEITAAFALAHRMGQQFDTPAECRQQFQKIARLIWEAAREEMEMPAKLPPALEALGERAEQEAQSE